MKKAIIFLMAAMAMIASCATQQNSKSLPRGEATPELDSAFATLLDSIPADFDIHSIMIVKDGKVVEEKWMSEGNPDSSHVMWSCSKTFTATAVGFAISEGKLSLDDKIVDIFPEFVPENASDTLKSVTIENLLTMSCGHHDDPTGKVWDPNNTDDWRKVFMEFPIKHEPGTYFWYNTLGTYMLSAAVTARTGEKIVDYLDSRLWQPLGIDKPVWDESPAGINDGGWGLHLKTEDMAKMGLLILQDGKWNGKQVLPEGWAKEMTTKRIYSLPAGWRPEAAADNNLTADSSDWLNGYCYQMWRCRHNGVRADGAYGQFIIILPDQNAVVAMTAHLDDMQKEINLIWDYILPAL